MEENNRWQGIRSALDTAAAETEQLRKALAKAKGREKELRLSRDAIVAENLQLRRELATSKPRSKDHKEPHGSTASGQHNTEEAPKSEENAELIQGFNNINEGVNDLAYLISESLPKETLEQELTTEGCQAASAVDDGLSWLLRVARHNECTNTDVIESVVQHLMHRLLVQYVFGVWSPGMEENESTTLRNLYAHILGKETQDRAARWRSMTYQSCHPTRDDVLLVSKVVTHFFSVLGRILDALLLSATPESDRNDSPPTNNDPRPTRAKNMTVTFTTTFTDQISKLVSSAIRLQDKMRATYLSFDYQPFSPRVGEYDRNVVEPSDKISHWTDKMHLSEQWAEHGFKHGDMMEGVLAQTALGLRASKSVAKSQGTGMDRQYKVVVRAKAIVGRFTFVKIAQASSSAAPPANHE